MKRIVTFVLIAMVSLFVAGQGQAVELKDISYNTQNAGKVIFSHKQHLAKKNRRGMAAFSCATCHTGGKSKKRYTMEDMYKGESCGACHNGKQAFDAHDCSKCHQVKDVVYQVKETGPTPFSHGKHLAKVKDCSACHDRLYKIGKNRTVSMAEMDKGQSCGACHNNKAAFGTDKCSRCHKSPELSYKTQPVTNATFSHSFHTQLYSCKDCHTGIVKPDMKKNPRASMAQMEKGESCGRCHDGKTAFSVKGDCAKCHAGLKAPQNLTFKNKKGTITGYFSHQFHTAVYQCSDCHTKLYPYGNGKRVTMKEMEKGDSCGACHDSKSAFSIKGDCNKCHKRS